MKRRRRWARVGGLSFGLAGACVGQTAPAGCASTPAGAIEAARAGAAASQTTGYRVESVRWDAAQRQTWAVIRSCDHAERPALAMLADLPHGTGVAAAAAGPGASGGVTPVSAQMAPAYAAAVVVHAGEAVRLWRADGQAHIELTAVAEENGAVGVKVRLRLMVAKEADGQSAPPRYFAGIVRGPADVEMER